MGTVFEALTTVTTQHIPQWFIKINSELSMIWYWDFYFAKCQIHLLAYHMPHMS